ncbi:unnamed protein product, partial [Ilex paraguariensis]
SLQNRSSFALEENVRAGNTVLKNIGACESREQTNQRLDKGPDGVKKNKQVRTFRTSARKNIAPGNKFLMRLDQYYNTLKMVLILGVTSMVKLDRLLPNVKASNGLLDSGRQT